MHDPLDLDKPHGLFLATQLLRQEYYLATLRLNLDSWPGDEEAPLEFRSHHLGSQFLCTVRKTPRQSKTCVFRMTSEILDLDEDVSAVSNRFFASFEIFTCAPDSNLSIGNHFV